MTDDKKVDLMMSDLGNCSLSVQYQTREKITKLLLAAFQADLSTSGAPTWTVSDMKAKPNSVHNSVSSTSSQE
jgi:hypothetical protein